MAFVESLRLAVQSFSRRSFSLLGLSGFLPDVPAWSSRDFEVLAKEGYLENATAYACIEEIASACAGIPWIAYKKQRNGKQVPYYEHPVLDLLERPNRLQTGAEFTHAQVAFQLIAGHGYALLLGGSPNVSKDLTRLPKEMVLPRPDLVKVVPDSMGLRAGYKLDKEDRIWHPSRVEEWVRFNPLDPVEGASPMAVAGKDVDVLNALTSFFYSILKRNGRPDGLIIAKAALSPEQYGRLKKEVNDNLNNANSPSGFKLMEGNVDVKEFAHKPVDMGLSDAEVSRIVAVCRAFKVPPEIIGVAQVKTFSNYKEARKAFYLETILPLMDGLRDKHNAALMSLHTSERDRLDYDRDEIEALADDKAVARKADQDDEAAGRITANEYRERWGFPKAEDELADVRMIGVAKMPATDYDSSSEPIVDPNAEPMVDDEEEDEDPEDAEARERREAEEEEPLLMVRGLDGGVTWRSFDSARTGYLARLRVMFAKILSEDYRAIAQAFEDAIPSNASQADALVSRILLERRGIWEKAYSDAFQLVGVPFARRVDKGLGEAFKRSAPQKRAATETVWAAKIAAYIADVRGTKIQGITETTRRRIMSVAATAYAEGKGIDLIAAAIRDSTKISTTARALLIARTEVIAASNAGSDAAAQAFGIPLVKEWLATADGRTRADHDDANGQKVSTSGFFEVGGFKLAFPGDTSQGAPVGEVANCRCTQVYEAAQGGEGGTVEA